jgi:maleylacetate reductase
VLAAPYGNPREVTREGLVALLHRARVGEPPEA